MGTRVNSPPNFTTEGFLDNKRSGTMRREQDTKVSNEHETLVPENCKAMPFGEECEIIVFNANGTLLGIRRGKLSTSPKLDGLLQPRAITSNKR